MRAFVLRMFVSAICLYFILQSTNDTVFYTISAVVLGVAGGPIIDFLLKHAGEPFLLFKVVWATIKGDRIRISCGYLIRIEANGYYLSVRGSHFNKYIAPGGVYKLYDLNILSKFGLTLDKELKGTPDGDMRLRFQGPLFNFFLFPFLAWFYTKKGREVPPWREFSEELLETNYLPTEKFSKPNFELYKPGLRSLSYSKKHSTYELLIHDVFVLKCNLEQKEILSSLQNTRVADNFCWQTATSIKLRGRDSDIDVSNGTNLEKLL